jgi:formylglycine-generating enzyme required for sulfatase activity
MFPRLPAQSQRRAKRAWCAGLALAVSLATLDSHAAAAGGMAGWKDLGNAVLARDMTPLRWTQRDNGQDISWDEAKAYCAKMGQGWRLPHAEELTTMYADAQREGDSATCGNVMCQASPLFHLSRNWYWSDSLPSKEDAADFDVVAWGVSLANGRRNNAHRDASYGSRALCVQASAS